MNTVFCFFFLIGYVNVLSYLIARLRSQGGMEGWQIWMALVVNACTSFQTPPKQTNALTH